MKKLRLSDKELDNVTGGTDEETTRLIEMLKYAGYREFGDRLYQMDSVERAKAMREFLNMHGCGSYGLTMKSNRGNMYSKGKTLISHRQFMNDVGQKLGLSEVEVSIFL